MIVSKGKNYDKRVYQNILMCIEFATHQFQATNDRFWRRERAFFKKAKKRLEKRIKTHTYEKEDEEYQVVSTAIDQRNPQSNVPA